MRDILTVMDDWSESPTSEQLAEARRRLERWGGELTGEPWALVVQTDEPLEETVILIAATEDVYRQSSGRPTGLEVQGLEVGGDYAVRIEVLLFDDPAAPLSVAPLLNPVAEQTRIMLAELAKQTIWPLVFISQYDGRPIGRRMMKPAAELRRSLTDLLELTAGRTISTQRWEEIASLINRRLAR
jgi:hypothetical protein